MELLLIKCLQRELLLANFLESKYDEFVMMSLSIILVVLNGNTYLNKIQSLISYQVVNTPEVRARVKVK